MRLCTELISHRALQLTSELQSNGCDEAITSDSGPHSLNSTLAKKNQLHITIIAPPRLEHKRTATSRHITNTTTAINALDTSHFRQPIMLVYSQFVIKVNERSYEQSQVTCKSSLQKHHCSSFYTFSTEYFSDCWQGTGIALLHTHFTFWVKVCINHTVMASAKQIFSVSWPVQTAFPQCLDGHRGSLST